MFYTFVVALFLIWLLGFVSAYTLGGYLHILPIVALILLLVGFVQGRRLL